MLQHRRWRPRRTAAAVAIAALALAWTGAVLASMSGPGWSRSPWGGGMMNSRVASGSCPTAAVSSPYVRFSGVDAGGMMGGAMYRLLPTRASVPAGSVTIDLVNRGTRPHELLVFPLGAKEAPGWRSVQSDDRVSEARVIGEVSPLCDQSSDVDGIAVGNVGRVTLPLSPGRYEVVCNLPGHYRVGMWAELDVV